jgi:hypothetical protein
VKEVAVDHRWQDSLGPETEKAPMANSNIGYRLPNNLSHRIKSLVSRFSHPAAMNFYERAVVKHRISLHHQDRWLTQKPPTPFQFQAS